MATNLVILESPSKALTVKGYLGTNYKVIASIGHVRDLPKSTLGVDIENDFEAHYINIRGKGDLIKEIRKSAKGANKMPKDTILCFRRVGVLNEDKELGERHRDMMKKILSFTAN